MDDGHDDELFHRRQVLEHRMEIVVREAIHEPDVFPIVVAAATRRDDVVRAGLARRLEPRAQDIPLGPLGLIGLEPRFHGLRVLIKIPQILFEQYPPDHRFVILREYLRIEMFQPEHSAMRGERPEQAVVGPLHLAADTGADIGDNLSFFLSRGLGHDDELFHGGK